MPKAWVPCNRATYSGLQRGRQARQGHLEEQVEEKQGLDPQWDHPPHCSLTHPSNGETEALGGGLFARHQQPGAGPGPGPRLQGQEARPKSDLCTRPSSASEASRAASRRHLCSRPRCCRRSRAVVRRSGHSISHSGLNGQRAQSPEPLLIPRLCLCQVPLTHPRAAGQLSCPRGTQVRSPWPDRGRSGPLRVGRTQTLPLTGS